MKLRLTPTDKKLENHSAVKEMQREGYTGSVEWRSTSRHFSAFFIWALFDPQRDGALSLVLNYSGRRLRGGVLFHSEIQRPISPNLLYCRVFVISQPACPGTGKELHAAAEALERLIDATGASWSRCCTCCHWLTWIPSLLRLESPHLAEGVLEDIHIKQPHL